jgi:hypothetical protein
MTELEIVGEQATGKTQLLAANFQGNIEVGILLSYQGGVQIGSNLIMSSPPAEPDLPISL